MTGPEAPRGESGDAASTVPDAATLKLLFGTDEPVATPLMLSAGRLQACLRGTRLGPVCFDGHEVWHGVDFLYRDTDWGTPRAVVERVEWLERAKQSERAAATAEGLRLRLHGHVDAAARLVFVIVIEAGERTLRYDVSFSASADLATHRTGVVLMHPLAVCGRAVEIEHTDGRRSASTFPTRVAPWPPFTLVRAIRHDYADGAWARCRFEGDDFELEDQRNNADASFKTYNRSNLMPRPYTLRAGARWRQAVALHIEDAPARPLPQARGTLRVRVGIGELGGALPAIGTAIGALEASAWPALHAPLAALAPALLQLGLERPDEAFDAGAVAQLLRAAGGCELRLDIGGVGGGDTGAGGAEAERASSRADRAEAQLRRIAQALRAAGVRPAAVALFPSTPPVLEAARRAFPASAIGGGTPHFFTQLNRLEDLGDADFLAFTTAGVVHGAADDDIMAGLQSLPAMVDTLRSRHGPLPLRVGPSSIGARRSPLGGQPEADGTRRVAMARRDPRTRGLYGAAWTLGYVARLAQAGVAAITLHALQGDAALLQPGGAPTPAFEVLRRLGAAARLRRVQVSADDALAVLVLGRDSGDEMLLGNLLGEPIDVALEALPWPPHVRVMDAESLLQQAADASAPMWRNVAVTHGVLRLGAYAIASASALPTAAASGLPHAAASASASASASAPAPWWAPSQTPS